MTPQERRELIGELRGFFPGANENEQAGNAIEKALFIGMAYGLAFGSAEHCKGAAAVRSAHGAVHAFQISERYSEHLVNILEGK